MKIFRNNKLAMTVVGAVSLVATSADAVDFNATALVENTVTVTSVNDFDLGTLFATVTGTANTDGVGALVIAPDGSITDPTDSGSVNLISLSAATAAQGSVDMAADFSLTLPDTTGIDAADFVADAGGNIIANVAANAIELIHESANPTVPSLFLMHFTVGDVSGGTNAENATNDGDFTITQGFGESTYVFNIGATVTTEPTTSVESYQTGTYSGTITVTASY